jgi:S-(hydroxymethyl)glutathione dehydrogenase/alcohol dehydrogenase
MKTTAAILVSLDQPLEIAELEIPELKPGQVLVEILRSGVCHTQVLECRGYRGEDRFLPHCLGHEAGGIVQQAGPDVDKVQAGERVILSWIKGSGAEVPGTVYRWDAHDVNAGAVTTFSRHAVVSENRVTRIPADISMEDAAMLGCAYATGCGAVINTARASRGQSIVVFGTGGVGCCAIAGAKLSACSPIIAVDILKDKLATAKTMGATHVIDASTSDPLQAIREICEAGADLAVEATGRPEVMVQALACLRPLGGSAVIIGNARHGEQVVLDPAEFNRGKRLLGTCGGDTDPDRDFPLFAEHLASGRVDLLPLTSQHYALENINDAIDDLESGKAGRPIIDMSL